MPRILYLYWYILSKLIKCSYTWSLRVYVHYPARRHPEKNQHTPKANPVRCGILVAKIIENHKHLKSIKNSHNYTSQMPSAPTRKHVALMHIQLSAFPPWKIKTTSYYANSAIWHPSLYLADGSQKKNWIWSVVNEVRNIYGRLLCRRQTGKYWTMMIAFPT